MTAPWLGWAPPPIQKPSGTEGLGQMLQALGQMRQQQLFAQDLQNLKVHQDAVNASGVTEPAPSPRSRQMQQMMGQGMLQNLLMANQPMTPYQQAMVGAKMAAVQPDQRDQVQDEEYRRISKISPEKRTLSENAWVEKYKAPSGPAQTNLTVNTGNIAQSTKGMLEKELVDLNKATGDLENVRSAYQDKFSEYAFRGKKWLSTTLEKGGVSPPDAPGLLRASKEEITGYTDWYQAAKGAFLTFRKWATGVAGGEKEMNEIKTAFPEPDNLSPTEFRAAIDASIKYRDAYRSRLEEYLNEGKVITPDVQKEITRKALLDAKISKQSRTLNDISIEELDALNPEQLRELQETGQLSAPGMHTPQIDRMSQQGVMLR